MLKKTDTQEVIKVMSDWFNGRHGIPRVVRANSGPPFRAQFNNWLDTLGIIRETSSAYNPTSNGIIEKTVGNIERVLKKGTGKEDLIQVISDMNNTARSDNEATPAEWMSGRPSRQQPEAQPGERLT